MDKVNENSIITEIQNEYDKINDKWLSLHYHTFIGLVVFGFFIECVTAISLYLSGYIEITLVKYVLKYILSPFFINSLFILIGIGIMRFSNVHQRIKVYFISLLFVCVCLVFYTVHIIFSPLYFIFVTPVLLTVVYGDYVLTTVTALTSISAKIISELFIVWDPDKISPFENHLTITNFAISIAVLVAFYFTCIIVIRFEKAKNAASIQKEIAHYETRQKLMIDDLTKIYNRAALRDAFQQMMGDPSGHTYLFVMMDLDNFKKLNDTLGHDKGDQCLVEFGRILKSNCPVDAIPFRFGGDEFCILCKNLMIDRIISLCKSIQSDLNSNMAVWSTDIQLTASIGIASYSMHMSARQLLRNTDAALYHSKTLKGSICVYEDIFQDRQQ